MPERNPRINFQSPEVKIYPEQELEPLFEIELQKLEKYCESNQPQGDDAQSTSSDFDFEVLNQIMQSNRFSGRALKLINKIIANASEDIEVFINLVAKNCEAITKRIQKQDPVGSYEAVRALWNVVNLGDGELSDEAYLWISTSIERFRPHPNQRDMPLYTEILEFVIRHAPEQDNAIIEKELMLSTIRKFMKPLGLDESTFFDSWRESCRPEDFPGMAESNLSFAQRLESQRKGIVRYLHQTFGISDFSRYPEEMLLKQFDQKEKVSSKQGVIFYPRNDYNGAFYQNRRVFSEFMYSLPEDCQISVSEGGSKPDLIKQLRRAFRRNGKIDFAIIGGHGSKESIDFGSGPQSIKSNPFTIKLSDLKDPRADRSEYFKDGATLVLVSCSTGEENGIAQEASRLLGINVVAPNTPTNLEHLGVNFDGPIPKINARFSKSETKAYSAGIPSEEELLKT